MSKLQYPPQQLNDFSDYDYEPLEDQEFYSGDYGNQMPQVEDYTPQPQKPYNPYYDGIRSAIEETRKSLRNTDEQNDRSLRNAMFAYTDNLRQIKKPGGLNKNWNSVLRALSPAVKAYDEQDIVNETANQMLADKIMAYKNNEQKQLMDYYQKTLAAQEKQQRRQEDLAHRAFMENIALQNLDLRSQKQSSENSTNIDYLKNYLGQDVNTANLIPIEGKQERNKLVIDKKGFGSTLNKLEDVEKLFKEFRESTKDDIFDPLSTTGRYVKEGESLIGRIANKKKLKDEEAKREKIRSQLGQLVAHAERTLKGGVLGPKVIEMFEKRGLFPNYDKDSAEVIEEKLSEMKKHLTDEYEAAGASLLSGYNIDPYELARLKGKSDNNKVLMVDPETGEEDYIPQNRVQEALADGLVVVNE